MSEKILASDVMMSNDTWLTGLNNNDLVIGTSGCGKTRGYVVSLFFTRALYVLRNSADKNTAIVWMALRLTLVFPTSTR